MHLLTHMVFRNDIDMHLLGRVVNRANTVVLKRFSL